MHSPDEVKTQLGLPVVGQIPQVESELSVETQDVPLDSSLCTYFAPRSPQAEAFRALRSAIYFSDHGEQRIIHVAGAGPGDNTSVLVANLAISIAQSGRHILLIDADQI